MKKIIAIGLLFFLGACRHENLPVPDNFKPDFLNWKYTAYVNVNGKYILKYIKATKFRCDTSATDSLIDIDMTSSDESFNYYYEMFIATSDSSGSYRIPTVGCSSHATIGYLKLCCYSNPDAFIASYVIDVNDSINNFIRIHVDNISKTLSGMFKATMVKSFGNDDPDTVKFRCDTFYCKYGIQ